MKQVCRIEDFDTVAQTCSAPVWVPDSGVLPPLSVPDAIAIAAGVWALWACALGVRWLRKSL